MRKREPFCGRCDAYEQVPITVAELAALRKRADYLNDAFNEKCKELVRANADVANCCDKRDDLQAELDGYRNGNRDLHDENQRLREEREHGRKSSERWREVAERSSAKVAALTAERDALIAALKDTNAEVIRYGVSTDTYDWADMLKRTRANAKFWAVSNEQETSEPAFHDTCCGECGPGLCYVDQMTGA